MPTSASFSVNFTLIAELIVFVVGVVVVARYLLPPLRAAMTERQSRIDNAIKEAASAKELVAQAAAERDQILADARSEGSHILSTYKKMADTLEVEARQKYAARYRQTKPIGQTTNPVPSGNRN